MEDEEFREYVKRQEEINIEINRAITNLSKEIVAIKIILLRKKIASAKEIDEINIVTEYKMGKLLKEKFFGKKKNESNKKD